jgi:hypothetical protein
MTKQLMKIEIETKKNIDNGPAVRIIPLSGSETPGARPANLQTEQNKKE